MGKTISVKKVLIRLKSTLDGEETCREYTGEYLRKGGSHNIAYTDYAGNAITKVALEANQTAMLLHRVGGITADMYFDPAADRAVAYAALSLKRGFMLHTYDYRLAPRTDGLSILVEYGLNDGSGEDEIRGRQEFTIIFDEEAEG